VSLVGRKVVKLSSDMTFLHKWFFPAIFLTMAFGSIVRTQKGELAFSILCAFILLLMALAYLYWVRDWAHCLYKDEKFRIKKNLSERWISEQHLVSVRPHRVGNSSNIELIFEGPEIPRETVRIRPPGIFSLRKFDEVAAFLAALVERNAESRRRIDQ